MLKGLKSFSFFIIFFTFILFSKDILAKPPVYTFGILAKRGEKIEENRIYPY